MEARDASNPLSILVIGAGFSGICAGIRLLQEGINNFHVVEKSRGIGGTWYDNSYPGAACDVPSHFYCFSFEPNADWSRVYAPQPEIREYLEHCVDKYGLAGYITHGALLIELRLIESIGVWRASFADGSTTYARHVISGAGGLHKPSYPNIPGRHSFGGHSMHTARWDHAVALAGKRVAVIGTAASAIQAIPEIAKAASQVFVFQRTPNYIAPRMDRAYTDAEKKRFAKWPWFARAYRWMIFMRMEWILFPLTRKNSRMGLRAARRLRKYMRSLVSKQELHELLEPDYRLGCKRILISDNFYGALNRDNVAVIASGIEAVNGNGLRDANGVQYDADVIVFATGFDIDAHMRAIDIIGQGGRRLADDWEDGQEAYQGACVAGFPNFYMVTGPNTGVATTSVVYMVEKQVDYLLQLIKRAGERRMIGVTRQAQQTYNERIHEELQETIWVSGCASWYRRPDGKVTTLYPGNARRFAAQSKRIRNEHFDLLPVAAVSAGCKLNTVDEPGRDSYVTANGIRLAIQQHGPEDAPVMLLIHGLGVPLSGWPPEFVQMLVARGYRVVLFDNRDIGRSELMTLLGTRSVSREYLRSRLGLQVRSPYQLTDMVHDAVGLLDALGIEKAHVIGVSMGGMIAQLLAIHAPDRLHSLTSIMSTTGRRGLPGPGTEVRNQMLRRPAGNSVEERLRHGMRTWQLIASPRWRRSAEETEKFLRRLYTRGVTAQGIARQTTAIMAAPARNDALSGVKLPTLVIHGDSDPLVPPACGFDTADAVPGARLEIIEGMGHDMPLEILERISDLLAGHARAADATGGQYRAA